MPPNTGAVEVASERASLKATAARSVELTWQEVAKHNTAESAWVIIDDAVYDVTDFLDKHPGGREMLLLAAGRDCTDMFNSYHWWDVAKARKYLGPYRLGPLKGPWQLPRYAPDSTGFYAELSTQLRKYFESNKLDPKGVVPGLWRLALIFAVNAFLYCVVNGLVFPELPFAVKLLAAAGFGVFQAMPLLHAMHDASHTAIGHNEKWWKAVGRLTLDWFAGGCMITWHHQHIIGHHVYTNVFNADPDVPYSAEGDPRFLSVETQKWAPIYAYQWLYLPVLYGLLGFSTRVQDFVTTYWYRTSGPAKVNYYDSPTIRLWLTKAVWATWRIVLPLWYLGVPASTFWPLFVVTELGTGYYLAWNFEVSHVADTVLWPVPSADGRGLVVQESWAAAQAKTSVDYGHNWWETWWSGALNYQIEHHLFPGISQYHYPAIAPIVREICKKHGVAYRYEPHFWQAWVAHVRHLYTMGKKGIAHKMD